MLILKYKSKYKSINICFLLGIGLGILAKYLDTVAVGESWQTNILHFFAALFTRLGIWVFIAAVIAAYSKTLKRAAINVFVFFAGMLISYYTYSAFLFGFFPKSYFLFWGGIALLSPLFAILVWQAKNKDRFAMILPALPTGLMLALSLGIGLFYMRVNHIEELILYIVLVVIFFKRPRQIVAIIILSLIVALCINLLSPFRF